MDLALPNLLGYVAAIMAFVALATLVTESSARIIVWPAVVVLDAGLVMTALAYAFYYHFGAWGSIDMDGKSDEEIQEFIASLRVSAEYITCWVRFGRIHRSRSARFHSGAAATGRPVANKDVGSGLTFEHFAPPKVT